MNKKSQWLQRIVLWLVVLACLGLVMAAGYVYLQSQKASMSQQPAAVTQADPITRSLDQLSTRQKIAALLMLHVSGTDAQKMVDFIQTYQPGGIILMGDNITANLAQVEALTQAMQEVAAYPLLIAIDEEGCNVKRLPQDRFACAQELGSQPLATTEQAFAQRSQLLEQAGINLNFGIVADITADPESFIYPRVFGADPKRVGQYVSAAVKASQPEVMATIKHFPGHGLTSADSHTSIPMVDIGEQQWMSRDAIPFKAGISAGAKAVMLSHLIYTRIDDRPASLSQVWHEILRKDLGFDGLAITDDLLMLQQSGEVAYQDVVTNVIASINAGNTVTLLVNDHNVSEQPQTQIDIDTLLDEVVGAVDDGRIPESSIDELVSRSLRTRSQLVKN